MGQRKHKKPIQGSSSSETEEVMAASANSGDDSMSKGRYIIIINIRGQIENRPLENTRFAGRKWLLAGR